MECEFNKKLQEEKERNRGEIERLMKELEEEKGKTVTI